MDKQRSIEIAINYAFENGIISNREEISPRDSYLTSKKVILNNTNGRTQAEIPLEKIQKPEGEREGPSIASIKKSNPPFKNQTQKTNVYKFVPHQTEEDLKKRAIQWAESMGYPVPTKWDGCLTTFLS